LVELLVAMAVALVLIVILFQIFNLASTSWQRSENQVDTYREARAALQLMVRELSQTSAPLPKKSLTTTAAAAPTPAPAPAGGVAPVLVLDRYSSTDSGAAGEEVYCLTNISNRGASALCAVGYFCQWIPDAIPSNRANRDQAVQRAPRAYALYRQFLDSDKTFVRFQQAHEKQPDPPLAFLDIFSRDGSPAPSVAELASFVWDLQFRIETSLTKTGNTAEPPSDGSGFMYSKYPPSPYPEGLPSYVEIRFKALSASAARQLEGNGAISKDTWTNPNDPLYMRLILPNSQQFVARVPLYNASLTYPTPTP
jgi:type II secretory pathway pseudopilin PulG